VVLARKDVGVAYHLAVVHDDALQGVTHVIRGHDLFEATHVQRLLQALLDLPTSIYGHHRLLTGPDGKRFAKRDGAQTLRSLREAGMTAAELRAEMGFGVRPRRRRRRMRRAGRRWRCWCSAPASSAFRRSSCG